jgi:hypothetical protein
VSDESDKARELHRLPVGDRMIGTRLPESWAWVFSPTFFVTGAAVSRCQFENSLFTVSATRESRELGAKHPLNSMIDSWDLRLPR